MWYYINLKEWPYKWVSLLLGGFFTPFLPLVGTHPDLPLRIQELCRWSADVNYVNKRAVLQCTALHMAIVSQCVDIVRFLQLESIGVFGMLAVVYVEAMVSVHGKLYEIMWNANQETSWKAHAFPRSTGIFGTDLWLIGNIGSSFLYCVTLFESCPYPGPVVCKVSVPGVFDRL